MSKAFYKLLFQNETLYRIYEENTRVESNETVAAEVPVIQESEPGASTPVSPVVKPSAPAVPPVTTPLLNHQILILVNESPALSAGNTIFLEKVLKAVNLNLQGVDVLNLAGAKRMDFRPLLEGKTIHHCISFGVPFIDINLEIMMNRYDPKQIAGVNFLLAESLDIIQADDKNKRALWGALKKIFVA